MYAFMTCLVREPWRSGDVANGVKAREVGRPVCVGHDMASLKSDSKRLETEILDVADNPQGEDDNVGGELVLVPFKANPDAIVHRNHLLYGGVQPSPCQ